MRQIVNLPSEPETRSIAEIERENEKLRKIVKVLVDRVERSTDAQGNAFSLFQAAITLETTVRQRTSELQQLNEKLQLEIEERRAIEVALERARQQAEHANLSKTEFLSAASHDLLQPLSIARLFLDSLAELERDSRAAAMLERIDRSLEAAESLLATLLEMSRIDAGALTADIADVPIDPLLKRLSDDYAPQAEDRGLRLRVIPSDAVVSTDLRLLERILRNLLSNALRYTKSGGVLVGCRRRGRRLAIEVWDTGRGIPADRCEDVFRDFLRLDTESDTPGMGLGLAIVERLSRVLRAEVSVASREGRGSVFRVTVPLGDVAHVQGESAVQRRRRAASLLVGKTVLLLERDSSDVRMLAAQLREWGLFTLESSSIRGAVAITNAHSFLPHAILIDEGGCGGYTGREAVDLLRKRFGEPIPSIVMTSDVRDRRTAEPGNWYLSKPLRVERLRSLLNHLFQNA